jgi:hypothetical protein
MYSLSRVRECDTLVVIQLHSLSAQEIVSTESRNNDDSQWARSLSRNSCAF